VEEILRALNARRSEEFHFSLDYIDESEGVLEVGLKGQGTFCMNDLYAITSVCEKNGFVLDDFLVDMDEGELVISLVIVTRAEVE
jgi:hypothetical protein